MPKDMNNVIENKSGVAVKRSVTVKKNLCKKGLEDIFGSIHHLKDVIE